jgi:hypothetical protein
LSNVRVLPVLVSCGLVVATVVTSPRALGQQPAPAPAPAAPQATGHAPGGGGRGAAPAPLPVLQGRPDARGADEILGETLVSEAAGIAVRVPAGMRKLRQAGGTEQIAQFVDEDRGWMLLVTRSVMTGPLPLSAVSSNELNPKAGVLEITAERLKANQPGAQIVRQDVIELPDAVEGGADCGLLAARHGAGGVRRVLSQQAIIQANDQLYYTLSLTSPAARVAPDGTTPDDDPGERQAVEAMRSMLDTVRLLDRTAIREDQANRLFRTRALFVNFAQRPRLEAALVPEQWLRILKDGKDVGYTYVAEEVKPQGPDEGIAVSVRSRSMLPREPEHKHAKAAGNVNLDDGGGAAAAAAAAAAATQPAKPTQVDAESIMWVSFDRRHETWSSVLVKDDGKAVDHTTEFGTSDRETTRVLDADAPLGDVKDPRNPAVREDDSYALNVTTVAKRGNPEPVNRSLPPFYLPQALGHLLPRLVPIREPKTYLFASYVAETREVMQRYVDVGREQEVELDGKRQRAVPVKDKIGLEGSVTTHWISPSGQYLGSTNADAGITVLPTDKSTLERLWAGANLTKPQEPGNTPAPKPKAERAMRQRTGK